MATEQEVLDDLIQAITNTHTSNDDFLKVLKEGRDQDVALRDGTVVPSLTKRVVNAFSNSDYLMKADNLASVVDKQEARDNLNVPTKEDVLTATAQATDTVKGTAKIATTEIAQAGTNDTDIITAKKLRDALNASGSAPIYACRGYALVNVSTLSFASTQNISGISKISSGLFEVTLSMAMPNSNYIVLGDFFNSTALTAQMVMFRQDFSFGQTTTKFRIACIGASGDLFNITTGKIAFEVYG